MMERQDREPLERFAREHHVHYEVEPEVVVEGERREVVGVQLRLFATHGESKLEAPACPRCVDLLRDLRSFADRIVRWGDEADRIEIAPASPALYASTEVPGADEVALAVRVRCDTPEQRRASDDRCVAELRERLREVGVPQR
jgi:hypothetical protein